MDKKKENIKELDNEALENVKELDNEALENVSGGEETQDNDEVNKNDEPYDRLITPIIF